jgi:hypothetical protein
MEEEGMHLMKGLVVSFLELTQQLVVNIGLSTMVGFKPQTNGLNATMVSLN